MILRMAYCTPSIHSATLWWSSSRGLKIGPGLCLRCTLKRGSKPQMSVSMVSTVLSPLKLLWIMHLISATSFLIIYGHWGMRPGLQQLVEMKVRDGVFWWQIQGLLRSAFVLQSLAPFDQPQSNAEPRGCCSEWRKTFGTHPFPMWAACSIWGLHSLLCIFWTGVFTAFPSITPFIILS